MISLFVIAGIRLYEEGLAHVLGADPRFEVVGSAPDCDAAARAIAELEEPPQVVLIDPACPDWAGAAARLVPRLRRTRTVALAVRECDEDVLGWAGVGVDALVTRDATLETLAATLESVVCGGAPCSPGIGAALMRCVASLSAAAPSAKDLDRGLTIREREIARLLTDGLSNKEIAARLYIELSTVKNHVHHVLDKLDAGSREEAAAIMRSHAPATHSWIDRSRSAGAGQTPPR